jgi:lysozyme
MPNQKGGTKKQSHETPANKRSAVHRWLTAWKKWPKTVWWGMGSLLAIIYVMVVYSYMVEPFGFRWRAIFGDPSYPKGYEIHGIDISHHQGQIDWIKLGNAMIDRTYIRFVMVKATEGADYIDENFYDNFSNARKAGFIRGAYHFWSTLSTAREQASFFLDNVKLEVGDMPPVLDVENKPDNMSLEEFQMEILAWLHLVEDKYHTKPIIYTYYKFKEAYLNDQRFDDYPYWIAHYYVSEMQYGGKWKFWQHTDVGRLPGIKGFVDLDIYNGSFYDLEKLTLTKEMLEEPEDFWPANMSQEDSVAMI